MIRLLLASLLLWLAPAAAHARQVALVVGIARYETVPPLKNPQRDAAAIADRLRDQGFDVIEAFDADRFALERARSRFLAQARGADLALFYFAGHGIQLFDRNVLLARDASPAAAASIDDLGLDLTRLMADLRAAGPVRTALLIDACRDNPLAFEDTVQLLRRLQSGAPTGSGTAGTRSAPSRPTRGLSVVELPASGSGGARGTGETLVFFAAQPGQVSFDGDGRNSYFVEGLVEAFAKADRPLSELLRSASAYVRTVTKGEQVPQLVSDWTGDVVLGKTEAAIVRYLNTSRAKGDGELGEAEAKIVGAATRAYPVLNGSFIVRESQSFTDGYLAAGESERARAKAIGSANGFAIDYDIDRDGRLETLAVYFRQVNVVLQVIDEGVSLLDTPCFGDTDQVEAVEIALRDINGDRRPEIFLHYQTELGNWGNFCILEYAGSDGLADQRRGAQGTGFAAKSLFRTLLRHEGAWTVSVGADNGIETCAGSNCHTRSAYTFDGTHFRLTLDQSEAPAPGKARPFRDHAEHQRNIGPVAPGAPKPAPQAIAAAAQPPPVNSPIARYVDEVYLAGGATGGNAAALQYESQVLYYGKSLPRAQVQADKARYFAKWPRRTYALIPATLSVTTNAAIAGLSDVAFEYTFEVADAKKTVAGRGRTRLTLRQSSTGVSIVREDGEVIERR